jgi:hypothetical protein
VKARWKILIAMAVVVVLLSIVGLLTMHIQPQNKVEAYKILLRAKGEKLEFREVLPPPLPSQSNSLPLVQAAFGMLDPGGENYSNHPPMMRMIAQGKALVGWAQPDLRGTGSDYYTNSWGDAQADAETSRPLIALLTQAAAFPEMDFQLDYSKGSDLLLPHLSSLKRCAQRLSAAAMCDLHRGDAVSATTNVCILLSLAQSFHEERTMISQLVRIAMSSIAASASWELLQSTNLTDAELAALQKNWERQTFIASMKTGLEFERVSQDALIQKMRTSSAEFNRITGLFASVSSSASGGWVSSGNWLDDLKDFAKNSLDHTKRRVAIFKWRNSWSYSDQLQVLQACQIAVEGLRAMETNQVFQPTMKDTLDKLDKLRAGIASSLTSGWLADFDHWLGDDIRELFSTGSTGNVVRKVLMAEASRLVIITAIALKRFQLKHGNFPEKLSELAPEFLATTPLDPVDGKPLRYRRNTDGTYLLYSIGENGVDDGGDVTPLKASSSPSSYTWNWQRARDWVWPQPATAAEVKIFFDGLTKSSPPFGAGMSLPPYPAPAIPSP